MNEFNKVRELIESLTEFESKYIKSYFKNASSNYNPISASELYDKFVKNKYWDDIQMMDSIYGENNKIAFKKSLQRFWRHEFLGESLLRRIDASCLIGDYGGCIPAVHCRPSPMGWR